jgi:hypothetical protein
MWIVALLITLVFGLTFGFAAGWYFTSMAAMRDITDHGRNLQQEIFRLQRIILDERYRPKG